MNPYTVLGVERTATPKEIRKAYRSRSKKAHPDAGGSPDAQRALNKAHALLMDADKRRIFDETGSEAAADVGADQAWQNITFVFMSMLETHDPIKSTRTRLRGDQETFRRNIHQAQVRMVQLEKIVKRLKFNGDGRDYLRESLEAKRAVFEQERTNNEGYLALSERMLTLLDAYEFAGPPVDRKSGMVSGPTTQVKVSAVSDEEFWAVFR